MSQRTTTNVDELTPGKSPTLPLTLLGLSVVALMLAVHFGIPINKTLWARTFFDTLHVPVFAGIAVCLYLIGGYLPLKNTTQRVVASMAVVVVLSGLSEAAQIPGPRDASFGDLLSDWFGASSALMFMLAVSPGRRGWKTRCMWAAGGILILAFALKPIATVSAAYIERNLQQPVIFSADSRFNHTFVRTQNAHLSYGFTGTAGAVAARVKLGNGPWPGLIFEDIWPDWRNRNELVLDISIAGNESIELNLRVHDVRHKNSDQAYADRFNTAIVLTPETQTIRIPLDVVAAGPKGRSMDMAEIQGLVIFADKNQAGKEFILQSIRLE